MNKNQFELMLFCQRVTIESRTLLINYTLVEQMVSHEGEIRLSEFFP